MSHLVSEYSQIGGSIKSQPHVGGVKSTQVDVEDSWEDVLLPTTQQYGVGQTVIFEATQTSQYTDLSKSYVRILGYWANYTTPTNPPLIGDDCAPVCNFPSAMFTNVQLYLNNTTVSPNRGGDQWISFVDRLLLGRKGASENCSQTGYNYVNVTTTSTTFGIAGLAYLIQDVDLGYSIDQLDSFQCAYIAANPIETAIGSYAQINQGANMRANRVILDTSNGGTQVPAGLGQSEYIYQPSLGCWKIDKYIPDRVGMKLYLTVQDAGFYTMTQGSTTVPDWTFVIQRMELVLHRVKLYQHVVAQNSMAMIERPWTASTYQMVYARQTFNTAATGTMDLTGVYVGPKPKFVLVGVQDNANVLGSGSSCALNPYYMSEGGAGGVAKTSFFNSIYILVNGKQYPIQKPYQPSCQTGHVRDYRALCEISKDYFPNVSSPLVTYMQYGEDYTWYPFIIDPVENDLDSFSATEDVNIEVHGSITTLSGTPPATSIAHVICYVPSVLYVDGNRECMLKSKSGVPIEFQ